MQQICNSYKLTYQKIDCTPSFQSNELKHYQYTSEYVIKGNDSELRAQIPFLTHAIEGADVRAYYHIS